MRQAVRQQRNLNARKANQRKNRWKNYSKRYYIVHYFIGIPFTIIAVWVGSGSQSIVWAAAHPRSRGTRPMYSNAFWMIVEGLLIILLALALPAIQRFSIE
jgi:hypothetical protein